MLENYLAYFQYTNIKRKEKQQEMHHQIGFWHPDSNSTGKSHVTAHLEPQMGNGPRKCVCSMGETSKIAVGVPVYNPRTQTDTIIDLWVNCSSNFMLMLFVSPLKLGMLLSLCLDWPEPLEGFSSLSRFLPHLICVIWSPALTVRAVSRQVRTKVRGLFCCVSDA